MSDRGRSLPHSSVTEPTVLFLNINSCCLADWGIFEEEDLLGRIYLRRRYFHYAARVSISAVPFLFGVPT
jgi:hypothetical protein